MSEHLSNQTVYFLNPGSLCESTAADSTGASEGRHTFFFPGIISERYLFRLSDKYGFEKPNDRRALDLMNAAAVSVMKDLPELSIAYGVSDEYRYA